jgi:hypothetical protein
MKMVYLFLIKMEKKLIMTNKIKNIIYIIIGLYFILMLFIYRLIIIRLPKDLDNINLIFCVIFIIINFFCIYKTLKSLFNLEVKNLKFMQYLQHFYVNSMKNVDNIIKHKYLGPEILGKSLLYITTFFFKKINDNNSIITFLVLDVLPKLIFIFIFIFDIYIKQQFCYIYSYGWILLLPLIFSYILYTFKEFALVNIQIIYKNHLIFYNNIYEIILYDDFIKALQKTSLNKINSLQEIAYITLINNTNEKYQETLDFYINQLYIFINMYTSIIFFEQLKHLSLYKIFLLMNYLSLMCIWLYIFFFNIF